MKKLVAGILIREGTILLALRHRGRDFFPDVWDFPGGHCEARENFSDALKRELLEELGISPIDSKLIFRYADDTMEYEIFAVYSWKGTVGNLAPDEHQQLSWFTLEEASKLSLADARYIDLLKTIL